MNKIQQLLLQNHSYNVAYDKNQVYTHAQFLNDVSQCVANISELPHQSYLLFTDHSYNFAVNFIALLILQKDIVLTANNKPEWLAHIQSNFDATIGEVSLDSALPSKHFSSHITDHSLDNLVVPNTLNSTVVFFTSGSTSEPKSISKSINQILTEVSVIQSVFGSSVTQCKFLSTVSHHHIYGLIFRLLWPLLYRYTFYAEIVLYQEQLKSLCHTKNNICLISSPAFLSRQDLNLGTVSLKQCFSSGSLLSHTAAQTTHHQLGIFPAEVFGSTETGGIGYRNQKNSNDVWTLFPDITIKKQANQPAILSTPYLNQTILLDDDLELISDHQFKLLGRMDRVVKIEEKRVSLDAIEHTLESSPYIEQAKVVVLQHHRTFLGAVIVLSKQGRELINQHDKKYLNQLFKSQLAETYEAVAIPRKWRYLECLPYNTQGKLTLEQLMGLF
ncbi:MAG TPA: AMP-binding protein [Kangiella sp.]